MDDPLVARLLKDIPARKVGFAIENQADWVARDIIYDDKGHPSYRGVYKGAGYGQVPASDTGPV